MVRLGNGGADGGAVTEAGESGHRVLGAGGGWKVAPADVGAVPVRQGAGVVSLGTCEAAQLVKV